MSGPLASVFRGAASQRFFRDAAGLLPQAVELVWTGVLVGPEILLSIVFGEDSEEREWTVGSVTFRVVRGEIRLYGSFRRRDPSGRLAAHRMHSHNLASACQTLKTRPGRDRDDLFLFQPVRFLLR